MFSWKSLPLRPLSLSLHSGLHALPDPLLSCSAIILELAFTSLLSMAPSFLQSCSFPLFLFSSIAFFSCDFMTLFSVMFRFLSHFLCILNSKESILLFLASFILWNYYLSLNSFLLYADHPLLKVLLYTFQSQIYVPWTLLPEFYSPNFCPS